MANKSLETLLRLNRWAVDEKQKALRVLLDREKDNLAFEFIPAKDAKPRAPKSNSNKSGKKPAAQEDV